MVLFHFFQSPFLQYSLGGKTGSGRPGWLIRALLILKNNKKPKQEKKKKNEGKKLQDPTHQKLWVMPAWFDTLFLFLILRNFLRAFLIFTSLNITTVTCFIL